MDSFYDDPAILKDRVLRGRHRAVVGGAWDEIGDLQRDFLVARGLLPSHVLLDVGCGALRGGVKLIPYLDPGKYWGIDKSDVLLRAGRDIELPRYGLATRQPVDQLVCLPDFEFDTLGTQFDVAIAQSVFTHLSLNRIRRCLARLAPCLKQGARLYASFFEVADGADREGDLRHADGAATSHADRSFYHYALRDFRFAIEDLPLDVESIGEWGHPRGQRMLAFSRR